MFYFDEVINRRESNSLKWDVKKNELPMWVADMDFKTAPAIIEALCKQVNDGIFGYSVLGEAWRETIQNWWSKRHDFKIEKDWILFSTGVVPIITCAVKRLTNVGDNVLVQTPAYDIFFHSIENHGRHVVENKLKYDGNKYSIDFEDLESKLSNPLTTLMLLCNPHNPVGQVWSRADLIKIGELCEKYHVVVVSDEIHCDLVDPGTTYTPFLSASKTCAENGIMCASASKTFNMAGLQSSIVVAANDNLREKMNRGLNSDEIAEPNVFAVPATIAAFTNGEAWLNELLEYLLDNKKLVRDYCKKELPKIIPVDSSATYLMWLDCRNMLGSATEFCQFLRSETGLYLSEGSKYRGNGKDFVRMNIACPKSQIEDALSRLKTGVEAYERWVVERC